MGSKVTGLLIIFTIAVSGASVGANAESRRAERKHMQGLRLLAAAQNGDHNLVGRLLRAGVDVDVRDEISIAGPGETALHKAAFAGNLRVLKLLLKAGARVDARDERGETPLLQACFGLQTEAARILLAHGANVKAASSSKGQFPLQVTAFQGDLKTARLLRSAGADLNQQDELGRTALMTASRKHLTMVKWLLAAGANPNMKTKTGTTALMVAAAAGREDIVRVLVGAGGNVNAARKNGKDVGYYALKQFWPPNPVKTRRLIEFLWAGGMRAQDDMLWVRTAVKLKQISALKFLLSKGVAAGDKRLSALAKSMRNKYNDDTEREILSLLERYGGSSPLREMTRAVRWPDDPNKLRRMIIEGRVKPRAALERILGRGIYRPTRKAQLARDSVVVEAVRGLRRAGKKISVEQTERIWTEVLKWTSISKGPLFSPELPFELKLASPRVVRSVCALRRKPELLRRLIKMGLDVNSGWPRRSLLHNAVRCHAPELVGVLLAAGARRDVRDYRGYPLLGLARSPRMVRTMLKNGVPVHSQVLCQLIPFDYGSHVKKMLPIVPLLLTKGANPGCRVIGGETLLVKAMRKNERELVALLRQAGGRDPSIAFEAYVRRDPAQARRLLKSGRVFVGRYAVGLAMKHRRRELYAALAEHYTELYTLLPMAVMQVAYGTRTRNEGLIREARFFMKLLLARGLNAGAIRYENRKTLLMHAATFRAPAMMTLLIQGGAHVNARSAWGSTALIMSRTPGATAMLLRHGARVDYRDVQGNSALHLAVYEHVEMVRLLMRYGADPDMQNNYGQTPIEAARGLQENRSKVLRAMGLPVPKSEPVNGKRKVETSRRIFEIKKVIKPVRPPVRKPLNPANPTPGAP